MLEPILCCLAFAMIPLFAWLGHRDDVRRARAGAMPCRCRATATKCFDDLAARVVAWNTPENVP